MTARKGISLGMKLECLFIRRLILCSLCDEVIVSQSECQFDHIHAIHLDGPHCADNLRPVHIECHKRKSKGEARGRKKVRAATGANKPKIKKAIASAGFRKDLKRKINGKTEKRT